MYQGILPLKDGDGCGIVEKYLIHILVLLADCETSTEVNVTLVRVGSDEESIGQFGSIGKKNGVQSGRMEAFWIILQSFQHFLKFPIQGVPFQYTSLLRNVPEFV